MKAILVIDMPNKCEDCPFFENNDIRSCLAYMDFKAHTIILLKTGEEKADFCPLKPITDVIPVEYIKKWVKRDDDFWSPNVLDYFNKLYDDWRKENE